MLCLGWKGCSSGGGRHLRNVGYRYLRVEQAEDGATLGQIELEVGAAHRTTPSGKYLKTPTESHFAVETTPPARVATKLKCLCLSKAGMSLAACLGLCSRRRSGPRQAVSSGWGRGCSRMVGQARAATPTLPPAARPAAARPFGRQSSCAPATSVPSCGSRSARCWSSAAAAGVGPAGS